jgi:hypothetical protein
VLAKERKNSRLALNEMADLLPFISKKIKKEKNSAVNQSGGEFP